MASIGELFIELGVVGDTKQVEKYNKKIKEVANSMDLTVKSAIKANGGLENLAKGFQAFTTALKTSAVIGVIKTIDTLTQSLVQTNQAMLDLTRNTDIAQGTFQKWGNIGKMLGVENAEQQLESLNQRLFEMSLTGQGAEGFMFGGINPVGQDAEGVLEQLRQRVSGMNDTTATYLLQKMGLDPRMLHLLRMSRQEFESLGETIRKYQLSPEDTRSIQAMNIQLQIAGIKLRYLKDKAVMALMPAWTAFMESLARVAEGLETAVKWVTDLISKSPQLQSALKGVAAALAVILAITQPLWAALVALYLIIDDVVGYFQGKDSGIGALLYYLDDYIQELKDKFGDLSFDKVIPQVTLDVGEVIIKAGKVTLEKAQKTIDEHFLKGRPLPAPLASLEMMSLLFRANYAKIKETTEQNGAPTGGAAPIGDADGVVTGGAASLGYVGALPDLSGERIGETAPIDYSAKVELPEWLKNMLSEIVEMEKSQSQGYAGTLPNLENMFITPAAAQNIANNSTVNHYDQRQINQTNQIQTNQPAFDIGQQLAQARYAAVYGWV